MKDRERLRYLANKWMEIAHLPVMQERRDLWTRLHGLEKTRPMIFVETGYIDGFVKESELECCDPYLRSVEKYMMDKIIHAEEVGDDIVIEPDIKIGYVMEQPSFGVEIIQKESESKGLAYVFEHVIKEPEDINKLVKREFKVDINKSIEVRDRFEDLFGDILPVKLQNYSFMDPEGIFDWVGNFFFGLTWQLHRFIGLEQMLYWYIDYPDEMHAMMQYMTEDRLRMFRTLEENGCIASNADGQMAGPGFYGYCSKLPYKEQGATLRDNWAWCESQETVTISPDMYSEFVLPYLSRLAKEFGRIYYGCCESLHDRLDIIEKEITNIGAVSVSMWNNMDKIAEMISDKYVYSRKPAPPPLSGEYFDLEEARKDLKKTKDTAKDCCVEFIFRDLYDIAGDRSRLKAWTDMVKEEYSI